MIELIKDGATTCIDSSYNINYNGTELSEVWVCDTSNATCTLVWEAKSGLFVCSLCSIGSSDYISSIATSLTAGSYVEGVDGSCACVSNTTSTSYSYKIATDGCVNIHTKIYVSNHTGCPVYLTMCCSGSCYNIGLGQLATRYSTSALISGIDLCKEIPNGFEGLVCICSPASTSVSGSSSSASVAATYAVPGFSGGLLCWCLSDCDGNQLLQCSYSNTSEWCCCLIN